MKVFISWSGELSQKVAEALRLWLPLMIQSVEPFVSSEDTYKGTRWHDVVARELEKSNFGILCVTRENVYRPWLNFEAGALSKSVQKSHVSPFLIDIKPADITGPLPQFQATSYIYGDVQRLIKSMNSTLESPLDDVRIERVFRALWPQLQDPIDQALKETVNSGKTVKPVRTAEGMLSELLDLARAQQKTLTDVMSNPGRPGSLTTKLAALKEVDFTEAGYLLKRLREAADTAASQSGPETASMVQIRALVDLVTKCLGPALDVN